MGLILVMLIGAAFVIPKFGRLGEAVVFVIIASAFLLLHKLYNF